MHGMHVKPAPGDTADPDLDMQVPSGTVDHVSDGFYDQIVGDKMERHHLASFLPLLPRNSATI